MAVPWVNTTKPPKGIERNTTGYNQKFFLLIKNLINSLIVDIFY